MRTTVICLVALALAGLAAQSHAQITKKITEAEARRLISEHVGLWLSPPKESTVSFPFSKEKYPGTFEFHEKLQADGFIKDVKFRALDSFEKTRVMTRSPGADTWVEFKLTEKTFSQAIPYEVAGKYCLVVGKYGIERIVGVTDDNTVLWVGTSFRGGTDAARAWYGGEPGDAGKWRGRAKLKYDPFLERFLFLGWEWSEMEQENWRSDWTNWLDTKSGQRVCMKSRMK